MKTYAVRVSRRDRGWDAGIEGVGWIRVDRLTGVERAVRAHLAVLGFADARPRSSTLGYGPQLGPEIDVRPGGAAAAEGLGLGTLSERSRDLASRFCSAEGPERCRGRGGARRLPSAGLPAVVREASGRDRPA